MDQRYLNKSVILRYNLTDDCFLITDKEAYSFIDVRIFNGFGYNWSVDSFEEDSHVGKTPPQNDHIELILTVQTPEGNLERKSIDEMYLPFIL